MMMNGTTIEINSAKNNCNSLEIGPKNNSNSESRNETRNEETAEYQFNESPGNTNSIPHSPGPSPASGRMTIPESRNEETAE